MTDLDTAKNAADIINKALSYKDEEADAQEDKFFKLVKNGPKPIYTLLPDQTIRYQIETAEFTSLTINALNHPKNITKQAGRDYDSWIDIIALMREEIDELEQALTDDENTAFDSIRRSKEELGDVGACSVLLLDWIQSREDK